MSNESEWVRRHKLAMNRVSVPVGTDKLTHEAAIVAMFKGWKAYEMAHTSAYGRESVKNDYVLGPEWEAIGKALRALLNGETGRLDCGTLDGEIVALLGSDE